MAYHIVFKSNKYYYAMDLLSSIAPAGQTGKKWDVVGIVISATPDFKTFWWMHVYDFGLYNTDNVVISDQLHTIWKTKQIISSVD